MLFAGVDTKEVAHHPWWCYNLTVVISEYDEVRALVLKTDHNFIKLNMWKPA